VLTGSPQTKYVFNGRQRLGWLKGIKSGRNDNIKTGTVRLIINGN
jgi:hypothetical protein